ncbi:MAG: bifunctional DNA-formamidopyrimidine glycosylase/DNA-(apurinic or apyrimidinic site) lyase [Planctomycetota bacterium]
MPELPEIEHLRRQLEPILVGARVVGVRLDRRDVVRGRVRRGRLLDGRTIAGLRRHGKQLALVGDDDDGVVCIHLGMSGQLRFDRDAAPADERHVHCRWQLRTPAGPGELRFRDPRRFGGLWLFPDLETLADVRWSKLGPDALAIGGPELARRLAGRRRPIKSALLDQSIVAGVGNIYADEALFAAGLHPATPAGALGAPDATRLARAIRTILRQAVRAGGSTLRDYADATGRPGGYARRHRVYGRGGAPCGRCGTLLSVGILAQRTTTFCPQCQKRRRRRSRATGRGISADG